MKKFLLIIPMFFIISSCCTSVTMKIPDLIACTAAGNITDGADCSTINSGVHTQLTGDQFIAWLNPSSLQGNTHAAAIAFSAQDAGRLITLLDTTCTELKKNCTLEMQAQISNLKAIVYRQFDRLQDSRIYRDDGNQ